MEKLAKIWKNIFHEYQRHSLKFFINFLNFHSNYLTEILCALVLGVGQMYCRRAQIIGATPDGVNKYCTAVSCILGSLVLNMLHVTFLHPRNLRWLIDLLKICIPLGYTCCGINLANITINCNEAARCEAVLLSVVRHTHRIGCECKSNIGHEMYS
jgi:hypothetical protein